MAAHTHQFTLTGGVRDIADGEVFAGKGILLTRLKTPVGTVAFYNTHVRERRIPCGRKFSRDPIFAVFCS